MASIDAENSLHRHTTMNIGGESAHSGLIVVRSHIMGVGHRDRI